MSSSADAANNDAVLATAYNRFYDKESDGVEYAYDDNGNLISDINRGMSMAYNCLSLPDTISIANNGTITFCYDANAAKKISYL